MRTSKNKGYTLIELLLAISIMSVVLLTVYSSFSLGLTVYQRVQSNLNYEAQVILDQLTGELRSAYLFNDSTSTIQFEGRASGLKFVRAEPIRNDYSKELDSDLKEVDYRLQEADREGIYELVYQKKKFPATQKDEKKPPQLSLSSQIARLQFRYFDGVQWTQAWNSNLDLPKAVEIEIEFRPKKNGRSGDIFSTIVDMPI